MSYASRNNGKITSRNQGGGNKKQGLAPLATQFFISQANNVQYRTESGDGRSRDLVMCVNQLGGIGRHRSQFRPNADGNRGTFCIKPLLSVFNYFPNYEENDNARSHLAIYVNKLNIETLVNDFNFSSGDSVYHRLSDAPTYVNINFGGRKLDMTTTAILYTNFPNTNLGLFIIVQNLQSKTNFSTPTYQYLLGLKAINTFNEESQDGGIGNLLSGYNFTITSKSKPDKSLTFSSLTNENYYFLLKNWTNI